MSEYSTDQPCLDLDQVADGLAGLMPAWATLGVSAGQLTWQLTWRDALASWPQPIVTDRGQVAEPESLGITLTTGSGNVALVVIWRGGWADFDVLAGGEVTTNAPDLTSAADCAELVETAVNLISGRASPERPGT